MPNVMSWWDKELEQVNPKRASLMNGLIGAVFQNKLGKKEQNITPINA